MVARVTLTPKISNKPPVVGCRYDSRSDSYRLDKILGAILAGSLKYIENKEKSL
jgi:hypothetical protein